MSTEETQSPANPSTDAHEIEAYYDELASSYERTYAAWGYDAPQRAVLLLVEHASTSARVLDLGCGTGLSGRSLWESGFTEVDGADISTASLKKARYKEIYRGLIRTDLSTGVPLLDDDYDAVLCVGVLEHMPGATILEEMCRVTRPGGTAVFSQRDDLCAAYDFEAKLAALEAAGRWERLYVSKPVPYMPGNETYQAANITVRYYAFRVR